MSITLILIIVTGLISYQAFENRDMSRKLHHSPYIESRSKEWYRMLTAGFIHGSWTHLMINMFVLYFFGESVEYDFRVHFGPTAGRIVFVLLYLMAIVAANTFTYFKHKDNHTFASLGASGAVSAVLFAHVIFDPWGCLLLYFIIPINGIIAAILYVVYSQWASKNRRDHVDHDAHLWGAIFGVVFTLAMSPKIFNIFIGELMQPQLCLPPGF